ncbi:MAG TPA: WYL domain-containing protein, partial [Acidimicrobiia bacterium]|nr:WYL domain-containing protein [Acidimicrobiia bacterium]
MQRVIERILNLLAFLLTVDRPVTAEEIRFTVAGYDQSSDEAFRRTFERDKDLLRRLGIPLRMAPLDLWETQDGYVVDRDEYALADPGLTDEERAALWLAVQVVRLGGQGPGSAAILKLGGAPTLAGGEPLAADLGADADRLAELFVAVTERRVLSFTYRERPRRLEPYGIVHRRGHWYLVGRDRTADEVRAYRVDRMAEASVGERPEAFERPRRFRPSDALPEAPWEAGGDDIEAEVRFDETVAWWARRQLADRAVLAS